jgi:hypothetical protein
MHVRRFSHLIDSNIGGQKGKSFSFTSGELVRRLRAIHLRRTGGERSRDLVNSRVCRVRAQTLGIPSREDTRSEKKGKTVGSEKPIAYHALGGSQVERGHF